MPSQSTQKKAAKQPVNDHPKYAVMIKEAILALKERNGSSRQAIDKYIKANYKVGDRASQSIKTALKRGAETGQFFHTKGVGASGSFKVNKEAQKVKSAQTSTKRSDSAESDKKPKKAAVQKISAKEKTARPPPKKTAKKSAPKKVSSGKKTPAKKPSAKKAKESKAAVKKPANKKVSGK